MAGAAALAVFFMQGTAYVIRTELFARIQQYSFENFDRFRTGNLLVRLSSDVDNVGWAVLYGTLLILYAPFMMIVAFILTLIESPSLAWLLIVAAGLVLGAMALIAPRIDKAYVERQQRLDGVNNTLQESLAGIRVAKRSRARSWRSSASSGEQAGCARPPSRPRSRWLSCSR